jgi:hypothetical protein
MRLRIIAARFRPLERRRPGRPRLARYWSRSSPCGDLALRWCLGAAPLDGGQAGACIEPALGSSGAPGWRPGRSSHRTSAWEQRCPWMTAGPELDPGGRRRLCPPIDRIGSTRLVRPPIGSGSRRVAKQSGWWEG